MSRHTTPPLVPAGEAAAGPAPRSWPYPSPSYFPASLPSIAERFAVDAQIAERSTPNPHQIAT